MIEITIQEVIYCPDITRYRIYINNKYKVITQNELLKIDRSIYKINGLASIRKVNNKIQICISKNIKRSYSYKKDTHINNKITSENIRAKVIEISKTRQLLFHGSISGIVGDIRVDANRNKCDFGNGFYTGDNLEQAENRVSNIAGSKVYAFEIDINKLKIYNFTDDTLWALYVAYNRNKININKYKNLINKLNFINNNYELVIGYIADDKMAQAFLDFLDGSLTNIGLSEALKMVKYGKQYVFKSTKINKIIKNTFEYENIKEFRKNSINWGIQQKKDMDNKYENTKIKYRRQGLYIEECMEAYNK